MILRLLTIGILSISSVSAQENALASKDWRYGRYFDGTSTLGVRVGGDAWVHSPDGKQLAVSCVIDTETQQRVLHFYIKLGGVALYPADSPIPVSISVRKNQYQLDGNISMNADTFSIKNIDGAIIEDMLRARKLELSVPCASCGVSPLVKEFSLMGFNVASYDTVTACGS